MKTLHLKSMSLWIAGSIFSILLIATSPTAMGQSNTFPSNGNAGIGTTSPVSPLEIQAPDGPLTLSQSGVAAKVTLQAAVGSDLHLSANAKYSAGWTRYDTSTPSWNFFLSPSADYAGVRRAAAGSGTVAWTDLIRITSSGSVGIGTTTPAHMLHVRKDQNSETKILVQNLSSGASAQTDVRVTNDAGALGQLGIYSSNHSTYGALGANDAHVYTSTNLVLMTDASSTAIKFATGGNAEKVRIESNGNVGIGTASPAEKLHVVGNGKITGNLTVDGYINAKYQDVAEWVHSSEQLAVGSVVVLDSARSNEVIASSRAYDMRVAGVISEQPGIALGESGEGKVLVATTGRVRVKVDASRGAINIGDLLVTSDVAGVAMRSEPVNLGGVQIHRPGTIVGKALESLEKGKGEILVLLSLQ